MSITQKIREGKSEIANMSMVEQMELYFAGLELKYHFYLFLTSICLLIAVGHLSWALGFGVFFLSKLIAMILAKLESWKVESEVLNMARKTPDFMFSNLNWRN